jgi:hypothetical protein
MLYICIVSNKFDLTQATRVSHNFSTTVLILIFYKYEKLDNIAVFSCLVFFTILFWLPFQCCAL